MIELNKNNSYKIYIVGVGGTGSHLVSFLTHLIGNNKHFRSTHSINLIDGDVIEEKNVVNQKFLLSDVGKNKAEVLTDRYNSIYEDLNISYVDKYIQTDKEFEELLYSKTKDIPIIISCVDNNKARKIIDNYFNNPARQKEKLIYIDTGNSGSDGDLIGQTVVAYKSMGDIILPSVSKYFPLQEDKEEEIGCGQITLDKIQNIGANITSAVTVFNILNNIISFNKIEGDIFTFNASKIETQSMKIINQ